MSVEPVPAVSVEDVLLSHVDELRKPGVLSVRPGFEVADGWPTGRRAIVATVAKKVPTPPAGEALPEQIGGIPVDVRQASPAKSQSLTDPTGYARTLPLAPDRGAVPEFPDEHVFTTHGTLLRTPVVHPGATLPAKPNLAYTPAPNTPLTPVEGSVTIGLSASPDNGWATLRAFLSDITTHLTVGIYDFTSAHVLDTVRAATSGKTLDLVIDHPAKNPTADQTDEATVTTLHQALGQNLTQAWALTRTDPLAAAWIYPSAYHIKVAVKDHHSVWLSSGNWNNSNQPDIDTTTPAGTAAARKADRDWHVVINHPGLAATFEAYLHHDLTTAAAHQRTTPPTTHETAMAPAEVVAAAQTPVFEQFFPATTITDTMTITPLLTPDPADYTNAIGQLIASATTTLYMQFQYIQPPKTPSADTQPFAQLIAAVSDRQKAGVDVQIIMSEFETAGYLEQLQAIGIDVVHNVKIQNNVHNKGIVVDGHTVLVSSQNWSTAGTLHNRDAGVIITNTQVAQYFQHIFLHDWAHLAAQKTHDD